MKIKKSLSPIAFHCKSSFANALQELTSIDGNINRVFQLIVGISIYSVKNVMSG